MFEHMGLALSLLRSLTGKSQAQVAREGGIGKSQLSQYESSKVLPTFETLGRLLEALGATYIDFAYTLALVQQRAARRATDTPASESEALAQLGAQEPGLLTQAVADALRALVDDSLLLHRRCIEAVLFRDRAPHKERP